MDLTTATRPITDLKPHPHNPRNGDIEALVDSLRANGQYKPIVTTSDGTIIAGNHTYAAAMELGLPTLACVILDIDPFGEAATRIMLADNRIADLGRYDDAILLDLLKELSEGELRLDGTGYDLQKDLAILERKVEATLRFGVDQDGAIDEFDRMAGFDTSNPGVEYFDVIRVYFRDKEARDDFFTTIGRDHVPGMKTMRVPADWVREATPKDTELL